ncbi:hypothetical protein QCA50_009489 [Cerrena zonata]|uniref:Uncharacterized protein n=1 Tax=Cerrena zonata TaxID=2478898 RepID=A0AAW0G794_9APHY
MPINQIFDSVLTISDIFSNLPPEECTPLYTSPLIRQLINVLVSTMEFNNKLRILTNGRFNMPRVQSFNSAQSHAASGLSDLLLSYVIFGEQNKPCESDASDESLLQPLGLPTDAYLLSGTSQSDKDKTIAYLPLLVIGNANDIISLITSTLFQRCVWNVTDLPVVGISVSGTNVEVLLGWIDMKNKLEDNEDVVELVPHIARSHPGLPSQPCRSYYDLKNARSICAFSQFLLSLKRHFDDVIKKASELLFYEDICWRTDHGNRCPDRGTTYQDIEARIVSWRDDIPSSSQDVPGETASITIASTSSDDSDTETRSPSTHSTMSTLEEDLPSSSHRSSSPINHSASTDYQANWMIDRLAFSLPRTAGLKDDHKALRFVTEMTGQYNKITGRIAIPNDWCAAIPDRGYEDRFKNFMTKVRQGWPEVKPQNDIEVVDGKICEILTWIEQYPSSIVSVFEDIARMANDDLMYDRAVYEAESRNLWDALILQFYAYGDRTGRRRMLLEHKINFPRNIALDASVKYKNQSPKPFLEAIRYYFNIMSALVFQNSYLDDDVDLPESVTTLVCHASAALKTTSGIIRKASNTSDFTEIAVWRTKLEPRSGICDTICVVPAYPIKKLVDALNTGGKLGREKAEELARKSCLIQTSDEHRQSVVSSIEIPTPAEDETSSDEIAKAKARVRMAVHNDHILVSFFVTEHKRPGAVQIQSLDRCRQYLVSLVEFLETLGVKTENYPVFGLHVTGWTGQLIMARSYNDPTGKRSRSTYILDHEIETFDITKESDVFHLITVLVRLRMQEDEFFRENNFGDLPDDVLDTLTKWNVTSQIEAFADEQAVDSSDRDRLGDALRLDKAATNAEIATKATQT